MSDHKITDGDMLRIGGELVRAAGAGHPWHPKLWKDIERAFSVALNSPTFRHHLQRLLQEVNGRGTGPGKDSSAFFRGDTSREP